MTRDELKEIISRILETVEEESPLPACVYTDESNCDMTTYYAVGEEG